MRASKNSVYSRNNETVGFYFMNETDRVISNVINDYSRR